MRVVVDTNVLVSALIKIDSNPARILTLWRTGVIELVVSPEILEEVVRVLAYPRIRKYVSADEADRYIALLRMHTQVIRPAEDLHVVDADPDDDKFLALAVACNADCVVSGDGHLLSIETYAGIRILTPSDFMRMIDAHAA